MNRNLDLEHAREVAVEASNRASELLHKRFGTVLDVQSKGHADFVTELDKQCEDIIKSVLSDFDESIEFMGEETSSYKINGDQVEIQVPETCWIVDPLDGTSNFLHSYEAFAVSIALRVDSELCIGIVQSPISGDIVTSIKGHGAFRENLRSGNKERLTTKDNGDKLNIFATSFPFRHPEYIESHMELVRKLFEKFEDLRRVGSASLDLTWVASGVWSAFVERFLKPWDVAAGGLFVAEAGGIITDFSGDSNNWLTNGEILSCSSARVHEQIMTLIE